MHEPKMCPVCGSKNITVKEIRGFHSICCKDCTFDEEHDYDAAYPEERSTQAGKTKFSPYKRGGSQRTRK